MKEINLIVTNNTRGSIGDSINQIVDEIMIHYELKDSIFVKANMFKSPYEVSIGTHPIVIDELAKRLMKEKKKVWLGDVHCVFSPGLEYYSSEISHGKMIDLNKIEKVKFVQLDELVTVRIPTFLFDRDWSIINLPVLEVHAESYLSACAKNFMGVMPKTADREQIHQHGLVKYIELLYKNIQEQVVFNIVDAIISHEGNGPINGNPIPTNHIIYGKDGFKLDKYLSTLITNLSPEDYAKYSVGIPKKPFLLRAPTLLGKEHYDGNATIGQRGLLATIYDTFVQKFGDKIHFVFQYGNAKHGMINIAFNTDNPDCIFKIDGKQPSRRSIRKALEEIE